MEVESDEKNKVGQFGMLVVDPTYRGKKIANALVSECESWAKQRGCKTIKLGNSSPKDAELPQKAFLDGWYKRLGYTPIEVKSMVEVWPGSAELELVPNIITFYSKSLSE